jgi:hypothetical protein
LRKSDQDVETKAFLSHVIWNEPFPHGVCKMKALTQREHVMGVWSTIREVASVVGGLSTLGVGLAIVAALALDGWPMRFLGHV